jgi:hypothetical protein
VLLEDLGMFGNNVIVAIETFFHRRDPGMNGVTHVWMTELALNFLYTGMQPMAERDRLFRTDFESRRRVKIIKKHPNENNTCGGKQNRLQIAF